MCYPVTIKILIRVKCVAKFVKKGTFQLFNAGSFWQPQLSIWGPKTCLKLPVGALKVELILDPALIYFISSSVNLTLPSILFRILVIGCPK